MSLTQFLLRLFDFRGDPYSLEILTKAFVIILIVTIVRSLVFVWPAYLLFWKLLRERLAHRLIQRGFASRPRVRHEVGWSVSTWVVYAIGGVLMFLAYKEGWTRAYQDVAEYGWPYLFGSVALMVVLHDSYFYWTHRLLHWKPLFRHVHRVHHVSVNPSPWASFSFHPVEAAISFGIIPLIAFGMPFHITAVKLFLVFMTAINVMGHLGYEIFPRGFTRHWLTGLQITSTHHNMHHSKVNCNYGLYFNVWDRLMDTNHRAYHEFFDEVSGSPGAAREDEERVLRGSAAPGARGSSVPRYRR